MYNTTCAYNIFPSILCDQDTLNYTYKASGVTPVILHVVPRMICSLYYRYNNMRKRLLSHSCYTLHGPVIRYQVVTWLYIVKAVHIDLYACNDNADTRKMYCALQRVHIILYFVNLMCFLLWYTSVSYNFRKGDFCLYSPNPVCFKNGHTSYSNITYFPIEHNTPFPEDTLVCVYNNTKQNITTQTLQKGCNVYCA